ncbi:hypothetical protein RintRC_6565 [Richelia intracellularis]|nr:hypothetical protein RintRC_6565 [Richelia intracellularis]
MICHSEKLIFQKYNILRSHLRNVGFYSGIAYLLRDDFVREEQ